MTATFRDIKDRVERMIEEATRLDRGSPFRTSDLWRETFIYLDYIRELSDAQLQFIRTHTATITANPWFVWGHHPARTMWTDAQRSRLPMINTYVNLTKGLPPEFCGDEPVPNEAARIVGLPFGGRLITEDVVHYQKVVTTLFQANAFAAPAAAGSRRLFFEIGGGYGGLAHQIMRAIGDDVTYVIIDLPEMLFWSAVFLRLNNPGRRIYLYDRETFSADTLTQALAENSFVLLPNYRLPDLDAFPAIDLALNRLSMQEMTDAQVHGYCAFLARRLTGCFYSENYPRHPYNRELTADLYDFYVQYFHTVPREKIPTDPNNPYDMQVYLLTPREGSSA